MNPENQPPHDDPDLEAAFARWREQERDQTPPFEVIWRRASCRQRPRQRNFASPVRRLVGVGMLVATIAIVGWQARRPSHAGTAGRADWENYLDSIEVEIAALAPRSSRPPPLQTDYLLASEPDAPDQ